MLAICPNNNEVWIYTGCKNPDPSTWKVAQVLKEVGGAVGPTNTAGPRMQLRRCAARTLGERNRLAPRHEQDCHVRAGPERLCVDRRPGLMGLEPDRRDSPDQPSGDGRQVVSRRCVECAPAQTAPPCSPPCVCGPLLGAGNKFAVASSNKQVMVCWFDGVNNMWISKAVTKKAKSAVVALSWHPNSQILAAASTDYKARVLCAYLDGVDGRPEAAQFGGVYPPFGDQIIDFEVRRRWAGERGRRSSPPLDLYPSAHQSQVSRAWINDVAWSASGLQLAFVAHDGLLHIASFAPDGRTLPVIKVRLFSSDDTFFLPTLTALLFVGSCSQTIKTAGLPAMRVAWLTERTLVTAGHNLRPDAFGVDAAGNWSFLGLCDPKVGCGRGPRFALPPLLRASISLQDSAASKAGAATSSFDAAKGLFAAKSATRGVVGGAGAGSSTGVPPSRHQSAITFLQPYATKGESGGAVANKIKKLPTLA